MTKGRPKKPDTLDQMMAFEDGELDEKQDAAGEDQVAPYDGALDFGTSEESDPNFSALGPLNAPIGGFLL